MNLEIKISKKTAENVHQGKLIFDNGEQIIVNFSIADNELLKIHNGSLLENSQNTTNENLYHEKFKKSSLEQANKDSENKTSI